jgi:hypothetical protein
MNIRTLMLLTAVAGLLFGVGYIIAPAALLSFFGADTNEVGLMLARFFGGAVLGHAVLTWFARKAEITELRRHIVPALAIVFTIGAVLALAAQITGIMQATGWVAVALMAAFAVAWAYVQFTGGRAKAR